MLQQLSDLFWSVRRRWLYGLLSVSVAISICLTTPRVSYGVPWFDILIQGVQVIQLSNISDAQEVKFGQQINQQLVKSGKIKLASNANLNRYLNRIGQRLVQKSARSNIPYKFQAVNDKSINAFATMGGFVYINTGLMAQADNEAELASVVAHEIGHIVARHAIEQMRDAAVSQGLLSAAGLDQSTVVQLGVQLALSLPNSRGDELEADDIGLTNLKNAGYAPIAMIRFMEKLLKKGGSAPTFLSTHPATSERIAVLEKKIDPETANVGDGLNNQAYKAQIRTLL